MIREAHAQLRKIQGVSRRIDNLSGAFLKTACR